MSDLPSDSLQRLPGDHAGLQEHTEFLRRLARGLLLDPGRAEDALQETWLAALRQRGDVSRGWLAVVVRRIAMQMRRSEGRRRRREEENARAEHLPSAAEDAARLELTRRLVEEITALADPYRSVLLERFFDDLSVREIAERRGLPVATVRTQVRRGLQQLREQLLGDDKTTPDVLLTALLPLAGPSFSPPPLAAAGAGTSTGTWTLATIVQANLKLSVALLAVVFLSLVTWNMWPESARSVVEAEDLAFSTAGGQLDAGGTQVVPVDVHTPGAPRLAEREDLGESESSRDEAGEWVVRGVAMRNHDQDPCPGITIAVMRWDGYEMDDLPEVEERTVTDDKGRFELALDKPSGTTRVRVLAEAEDHWTWPGETLVVAGAEPNPFELHVLPRDATLIGRVHREDGSPVSRAMVRVGGAEAETDADGHFRLGIPSGATENYVTTESEGLTAKRAIVSGVSPGEVHEVEIVMRPEFRIRGTVRDTNGTPLAGAHLWSGAPSNSTLTNDAGEYALGHLDPDRKIHSVAARADGFVSGSPLSNFVYTETDGEAALDIILERGLRVSGYILDENRRPIAAAGVYIGSSRSAASNCLYAASRDDGRFELSDVGRGAQTLFVQRDGFAPYKRVLVLPDDGEHFDDISVVLGEAHFVAGTLRDGTGAPVSGVGVFARYHSDSLDIRTETDEGGHFRLDGLPADHLALSFAGDGIVRLEVPLTVVDRDDLEFSAQIAGRLTGRVIDGLTGEPIGAFRVRFVEPLLSSGQSGGDGYRSTWSREGHRFTDPNGRWDSGDEALSPGTLIGLEVHAAGYSPGHLDHVIVAQRGAPEELLVELFRGARVQGVVTDAAGGVPVGGATLRILSRGERLPGLSSSSAFGRAPVHSDPTGRFSFEGVGPGEYHILVEEEEYGLYLGPWFTVSPDDSAVEQWLELPLGSVLSGRLLDADGLPLAGEALHLGPQEIDLDFPRFWDTVTTDDGRYRFEHLPPGPYWLTHRRAHLNETVTIFSNSVELERGVDREVDLRPIGSARVHGTLSCEEGLPPAVVLHLKPLDESGQRVRHEERDSHYGALATTGTFEFHGVGAGSYWLVAFGKDSRSNVYWSVREPLTLSLTAGEQSEQRLELFRTER